MLCTQRQQIKTGPQLTLGMVHYRVLVVLNIQGSTVLSALVCGAYLSELLLQDLVPVDLKSSACVQLLVRAIHVARNKYAAPFHELGLLRDKAAFIPLCKLIICFALF